MSGGLWDDLKQARFLGHPIHMMIVHFPMALWPFGFVLDLTGTVTGNASFAAAAFYCITGGIVGALAAATAGAMDYLSIPSEHKAWKTASVHALLNVTGLMIWAGLWGVRLKQYPKIEPATTAILVCEGVAVLGLLVSAHLGGELVLRHRLGAIGEHRN